MNEMNQPTNIRKLEKPDYKYKQKSAVHISALTLGQLAEETMAVHSQCAPGRYQAVPSYWTVQSILRMYQKLIKSNPIITKSITNGIIALIGSSISQVCKT